MQTKTIQQEVTRIAIEDGWLSQVYQKFYLILSQLVEAGKKEKFQEKHGGSVVWVRRGIYSFQNRETQMQIEEPKPGTEIPREKIFEQQQIIINLLRKIDEEHGKKYNNLHQQITSLATKIQTMETGTRPRW